MRWLVVFGVEGMIWLQIFLYLGESLTRIDRLVQQVKVGWQYEYDQRVHGVLESTAQNFEEAASCLQRAFPQYEKQIARSEHSLRMSYQSWREMYYDLGGSTPIEEGHAINAVVYRQNNRQIPDCYPNFYFKFITRGGGGD